MAPADPAVQLAQRLASNDKRTRERALRKLRGYLRARSEGGDFTEEEFCKIWKGLFYCMWMQDKPLLQEDLAHCMSQLIHTLQRTQSQRSFLRTFWQTLSREWNGIDRLRMDKFYMLSRLVLRQSVEVLRRAAWEESLVGEFLALLVQEVLRGDTPRGVQLHLIDIYLDEVAKVGASELPADLNLKLIEPFSKIAAKTKDALLLQAVLSGIFQTILDQAPFAIEDLMKEINQENSAEGQQQQANGCPVGVLSEDGLGSGDEEDIGPVLQFDYKAVADTLFALASRRKTPAHNRKRLYRLVKQFQDLAEGLFPQDNFPDEVSTDEDDDEFSSWRFRKRQRKAQGATDTPQEGAEPQSKRGKRQRAVTTLDGPQELQEGATPPLCKKKRRKKRSEVSKSGQEEPPKSELNGGASHPPGKRAVPSLALATPPAPESDSAPSRSKRLRLTTRRRGGLIRLGLSVLAPRGGLLRRRRRSLACRGGKSKLKVTASVTVAPREKMPVAPREKMPVAPREKMPVALSNFVTFHKKVTPKPVYVKSTKGGEGQLHSDSNKKVTFSLNKNMTAEFKRTDRSLLVSPAGSSRVPFNPEQRPQHSVLKTPSPTHRKRSAAPRPCAADFF